VVDLFLIDLGISVIGRVFAYIYFVFMDVSVSMKCSFARLFSTHN